MAHVVAAASPFEPPNQYHPQREDIEYGTTLLNTENQDNHRLSAVSQSAAAEPGEVGPCGSQASDVEPASTTITYQFGEVGPCGSQASAMATTFAPNIIIMRSPAPTSSDPAAADIFTPNRTAHIGGTCAREGELNQGIPACNNIAGDNYGMLVQNNAGSMISLAMIVTVLPGMWTAVVLVVSGP
jgi:hypothetical protein